MCIPFSLPWEGNLKQKSLLADIQAMVGKGALIPFSQDPGPGFYCNLFLVMTGTEGCRPVINLKALNWFLHILHFKMERKWEALMTDI